MRESHIDPARLLVVDDNKVNRLLLSRSLELQGHRVASAENGRRALEMLRLEAYDLVLLDMEMPEMDGFQVLEQMKQDRALRDTPVIVTSSLEGIENVVRCIELGAEDYLPKPVNPVLLKARIGASLEKKRLRDEQKELLRRFATPEVAQDMQQSGFALGGKRIHGTVLFSDIRDFTPLAESQPPEETIDLLNTYYTLMFDAISTNGGVVTLIIGDGLMAIFGAPMPLPDHAACAVRAAVEMTDMMDVFNAERAAEGKAQIRIGIGIATGEMVAGYAGTNARATYTCIGNTVNLASRIETHTKVARRSILLDSATRAVLPDDVEVESLGAVVFKGISAPVEVFSLAPPRAAGKQNAPPG
jgi:adenylate cyclase